MCGLIAVISKTKNGFSKNQVDMFSQMLHADEVRGMDGTGIFYNNIKNEPKVTVLKAPYRSSFFVGLPEYQAAKETMFKESNFAVGHNRAATKGKVDASCTHPFRENHIVLVHNGTLYSHKELHADYEVDSRAICHSIATIGAHETIEKLDGAFALIWWDTKEKTLNFCRNAMRPLFLIETSSSFLLVSELDLGMWILGRNNEKCVRSMEVTTKVLYKFNLEDMTKYTEEPLNFKAFVKPKYNQYSNYQTHSSGGSNGSFSVAQWANDEVWNKKDKPILSTKGYSFGQKIKFKIGDIKGNYVEADILKHQDLGVSSNLLLCDFESEWRIKIFGSKELLKLISNKRLAEGVINRAVIFNNKVTYHVGGITLLDKPDATVVEEGIVARILQLPIKYKNSFGGARA